MPGTIFENAPGDEDAKPIPRARVVVGVTSIQQAQANPTTGQLWPRRG